MQIRSSVKRNLALVATVGVAAFALQMTQPVIEARGESIFSSSNSFFNFSGNSTLSSERVLGTVPNIGLDENSKALDAYKKGDFATARKLWEKEAEAGDIFAQWMLARMYYFGQGVNQDDARVWHYYRAVAGQYNGDESQETRFHITVDATYWVGYLYSIGVPAAGVQKSTRRALRLFKKAAGRGHPAAQYELGRFFLKGIEIRQNYKEGRRWVQSSAMKRHAPAMATLGSIYWNAGSTGNSRAKGLMWYTLAKENACPSVHHDIFARYEELYVDATDDERSRAEASAYRWNQNHPVKDGELIYRLANCN